MNKDALWNLVLIVSLVLLIHGLSNTGDKDKKAAEIAQSESIIGSVGLASFVGKKAFAWVGLAKVLAWPLVGFLLSLPFTIKNVFSSSPTIPAWAWVVGAVLLFLIIARMGKR